MRVWCIVMFAIAARPGNEGIAHEAFNYDVGATTLQYIHDIRNVAALGDAHHREEKWISYDSSESTTHSDMESTEDVSSETLSSSYSVSSSSSSGASSAETSENRRATETFRSCHACPHDMMKKHTNRGIKWICAAYQRARRTFKSECMMRYRNCQDGTMFVKLHDYRCPNDTYHGRHWFYVYKT